MYIIIAFAMSILAIGNHGESLMLYLIGGGVFACAYELEKINKKLDK